LTVDFWAADDSAKSGSETCAFRFGVIAGRLGQERVTVVGDPMLDRFVYVGVARISPEAPVFAIGRESMIPGGGNVARNIAGLSGGVRFLTVIGADQNGADLTHLMHPGHSTTATLARLRA
jgi:D-beta-D-heptose 7-phosphate kinase/D-beta-D-heptose 1-phosphate adenosyltransferase